MTTILTISSLLAFSLLWTFISFLISLSKNLKMSGDGRFNGTKLIFKSLSFAKVILLEYFSFVGIILLYPFGFFDKAGKGRDYRKNIPILLVHGYLHNSGAFVPIRLKLRRDKITNIFPISLKPTFASIKEHALRIKEKVEEIILLTGCEKINIVTHSMGGLVAMYYIKKLGGHLRVNRCITMACPHRGTEFAKIAWGKNGREMRPGSELLSELEEKGKEFNRLVVSIWSDIDNMIIPADSAVLDRAKNIKIENLGHVAFLFSPRVYKIIKENLI